MDKLYTQPLGADLVMAAPGFHVRGIAIDNNTGSWLHIENLNEFVPPFTIGWQRDFPYGISSVSVRFTDSPTGTPSQNIGTNAVVRLFDYAPGNDSGQASGAEEFQTAGKARKTFRFDVITPREVLNASLATITPAPGFRLVLLRWRVTPSLSVAQEETLRTMAELSIIDGLGANIFPPIIVSPITPDSGFIAPTGRQLDMDEYVDIAGIVAMGGGYVTLNSYLEYYSVEGPLT